MKVDEQIEAAVKAVAQEYGITAADLAGGNRTKPLPEARQMYCYILATRVASRKIYERINKKRLYIHQAITKMEDLLMIYGEVRERYNNIMDKLGYDD